MKGSAFPGAFALFVFFAIVVPAFADDAEEGPELGRDESRIFVFAGGGFGRPAGSEVDDADVAFGYEAGGGLHLWRSVSLVGAWAVLKNDIYGQMTRLLDYKVRESGRSGLVDGSIESSRVRAGLRFDPVFADGWRYHPHLALGATYSKVEARIDMVNRVVPVPFKQSRDDEEVTDIRAYDFDQFGGFARFGIEVDLRKSFAVDVGAAYEILEFPPGTNSLPSGSVHLIYKR